MAKDKDTLKENKELKNALQAIEKEFGKGSIMSLGDMSALDVEGISTGSLGLDIALGGKGLPRGRIIEAFGAEASGKTTIALHTVAEAQKAGGVAAYIDAEHALDPTWAKRIGVDLDNLLVSQPGYGEEGLRIAEMLIKSNAVDIIVDRFGRGARSQERNSEDSEIGDTKVGLQARLMSQALRILNPTVNKSRTCLMFINQIRQKIGVMYGDPNTTTGGLALKFYASVRMEVKRVDAREGRRRNHRLGNARPRGEEQDRPAVPQRRVQHPPRSRHRFRGRRADAGGRGRDRREERRVLLLQGRAARPGRKESHRVSSREPTDSRRDWRQPCWRSGRRRWSIPGHWRPPPRRKRRKRPPNSPRLARKSIPRRKKRVKAGE